MSYFEYIYIFPTYAYVSVATLFGKQRHKWAVQANDELLTLSSASQQSVLKFAHCWKRLTGEPVMVERTT